MDEPEPSSDLSDLVLERLRRGRPRWGFLSFLGDMLKGALLLTFLTLLAWGAYQRIVPPIWSKLQIRFTYEVTHPVEELQQDLEYLRSTLESSHPRLLAHQERSEWEAGFHRVDGLLRDRMSRAEFLGLCAPLVARIGCGHTGLRPPAKLHLAVMGGGRLLPLGVWFLGDRTLVHQHYGRRVPIPIGVELIEIDGRPVTELREYLMSCFPSDGRRPTYNRQQVEDLFPYHYWVYVKRNSSVRVTYRDPDGAMQDCTLRVRPGRKVARSFFRQNPRLDPVSPPPSMRAELLEPAGVGYLRLHSFAPEGKDRSQERFREHFMLLAANGADTLILDVRGNGGGPPPVSVDLLRYLMPGPFIYLVRPEEESQRVSWYEKYYEPIAPHENDHFGGRLYVLMDHGSFSTTGHFLSHLREREGTVFVGRESGGGALCSDASLSLELPNTRLRLRVATKTFTAGVDEALREGGVPPDIELEPRLEDLTTEGDPDLLRLGEILGIDMSLGQHFQ